MDIVVVYVAKHFHLNRVMVVLNVKKGEESLFLFATTLATPLDALTREVADIYNGILRVDRACSGSGVHSSRNI